MRSPLRQPAINVKEGDWLLAVNGRALDVREDPWAAFQGLADKPAILTVNDKPTRDGAREVLVQTHRQRSQRCGTTPGSKSNRRSASKPRAAARSATST